MPPPRLPTRLSPGVVVPRGGPLVVTPRPAPPVVITPRGAPKPITDPKEQTLALIAEVHSIKHQMSAHAHRLGTILRALQEEELFKSVGCATFDELLVKYELPNRLTAIKYIAIAEHFAEAEAVSLGPDKGYALVRYGRALANPEPPVQLLARNAKLAGVLLKDAPASAIFAAARELGEKRRAAAAADDDTTDEAGRAVRRLGAKLRRSGAPGATLKRVRRRGVWRVWIELDPDEAIELASHL